MKDKTWNVKNSKEKMVQLIQYAQASNKSTAVPTEIRKKMTKTIMGVIPDDVANGWLTRFNEDHEGIFEVMVSALAREEATGSG